MGNLINFPKPVCQEGGDYPCMDCPASHNCKSFRRDHMEDSCKATIIINGDILECHMSEPHEGKPHATRVQTGPSFYDGFAWAIDEHGNVDLKINASVAFCLFGPATIDQAVAHIESAARDLTTMAYEAGKSPNKIEDDAMPF